MKLPDSGHGLEDVEANQDFLDVDSTRDEVSYLASKLIEDSEGKEEVLRRLRRDPGGILRDFDFYRDLPYSDDLLRVAVKESLLKDPKAAVIFYREYSDKPYARQTLEVVAEEEPRLIMFHREAYSFSSYADDILEWAFYNAVTRDPKAVLEFFDTVEEQAYAEDMLQKAFYNLAETDPKIVFSFAEKYSHFQYLDEVLEIAVYGALDKEPKAALDFIYLWGDKSYCKDVLTSMSEQAPRLSLFFYKVYSGYLERDYAEDLLKKVVFRLAESQPSVIICFHEYYFGREYSEEALMIASKADPNTAVEFYYRYSDAEYSRNVLEYILRTDPVLILKNHRFYKDADYSEDLLREAAYKVAKKSPEKALQFYSVYKNKAYAKELRALAEKKLDIFENVA